MAWDHWVKEMRRFARDCCDPRYKILGKPLEKCSKAQAKAWLDMFDRHPERRPKRAFGVGMTDWERSLRDTGHTPESLH
jgi:hypothetical protein